MNLTLDPVWIGIRYAKILSSIYGILLAKDKFFRTPWDEYRSVVLTHGPAA